LWLPKYLIGVYGVDVKVAGMLAATFSLSASVFRAYGGILSDRYGARRIMYATFGVSMVLPVHAVLSGDGLHDPRDQGRHPVFHLDEPGSVRHHHFRARLLHVAGQGGGVQAHPGLLPGSCRLGRRAGRPGGRPGRVRPADRVRGGQRPDRHLDQLLHAVLFALVAVALAWMHMAIRQMEQKASGIDEPFAAAVPGNGRTARCPRPIPERTPPATC
jgi:NNP family nitrate/nitrite transporter-like MFS transporter